MKPSRSGMLHILWMLYISAVFMSDTAESRVVYYEKQMDSGDADYADLLEVPRKIPSTSYIATSSSNDTTYQTNPLLYDNTAQPYGPALTPSNYQTTTSYWETTLAPPKYPKYSSGGKKKVFKTFTIGSYDDTASTYSPVFDQKSQSYAAVTPLQGYKSRYSQNISYSPVTPVGQKCSALPLAVSAFPIDLLKMNGNWHGYLTYNTNPPDIKNPIDTYTTIGTIDGTPSGLVVKWTASLFAGPSRSCSGIFQQSFFTNLGEKNSLAWLPFLGLDKPLLMHVHILYTDYTTVEISARCGKANTQTGICEDPIFLVLTRQRPTELSQTTKALIADKIDEVLGQYCFSAKQLSVIPWEDDLSACNPQEPPQFTKLIGLMSAITASL